MHASKWTDPGLRCPRVPTTRNRCTRRNCLTEGGVTAGVADAAAGAPRAGLRTRARLYASVREPDSRADERNKSKSFALSVGSNPHLDLPLSGPALALLLGQHCPCGPSL